MKSYRVTWVRRAGRRLRAWRVAHGLSQSFCADSARVTAVVWGGWERGEYRPTFDRALHVEAMTDGALRVGEWDYDDEIVADMTAAVRGRAVLHREARRDAAPSVYVAAALVDAERAAAWGVSLRGLGVRVASTWHDAPLRLDADLGRNDRQALAARCESEVRSADALILLLDGRPQAWSNNRGSLIEFGIARGLGKPVCVVGRWHDATPLLDLPDVTWVTPLAHRPATETIHAALAALRFGPVTALPADVAASAGA